MGLKLNILISTFNDRINQVKNVLLEHRYDVTYIISHQYDDEKYKVIPDELLRSDVTISQIKGRGVTKSRNNVINLANGDVGLFSDDDVTYTHEYIDKVINTFSKDESLDVVLFKIKTPEGFPEYKKYPSNSFKIKFNKRKLRKLPFSVGTIEIAFRVNSVKKAMVFFDERFGAGQPLLIGSDESIFVIDCIEKKLNVWFYPEYIVNHPFESTVKLISRFDKRRVSVSGAYDARVNGWSSIPMSFIVTIRHLPSMIKNRKSPFVYLKQRLSAALYILLSNSKL